jgi:hypothetical protein
MTRTKGGGPLMAKGDLASTIEKHDADIRDLGGRINGVESGLGTLRGEVHTLKGEVNVGFRETRGEFGGVKSDLSEVQRALSAQISKLENTMTEQKASKGPGAQEWLRMAGWGGGLVAMSAAAIGFLVKAQILPDLMKLQTEVARVEASASRRDANENAELQELRRQRNEQANELKAVVEELKARVAWQPTRIEMRR